MRLTEIEFKKLILKYNNEYKIKSINKLETFKLNLKTLRNYFYKNILAFWRWFTSNTSISWPGF